MFIINPFIFAVQPPMPTYVGIGTFANGVGNITPTLPSSLQTNDMMILFCETLNQTVTAPSGWTQSSASPFNNPSDVTRLTLFYKRYVSGDTNPTITDPGDHIIASIAAFRGVSLSGEGISTSEQSGFSSTTNFVIPMTTTTLSNQFIALFIADGADVTTNRFAAVGTNATLANLAHRESQSTTDGDGGGINLYTGEKAVAGDCGDLTGTLAIGTGFACIALAFTG